MTQLDEPRTAEVEDFARELDSATTALDQLAPDARVIADRAIAAARDLDKAALTAIVVALRADPDGKRLLFELVDDPNVRMAMLVHGLIRPDPVTLAGQVLAQARIGLHSHGGDVELVRIEDGVAYVRLQGACNGCSMAAVTMRDGIEQALTSGVPGLRAVEVVPNEPGPALIPLSSIGVRPGAEKGWVRAGDLGTFDDGAIHPVRLTPDDGPEVSAIVVNVGGQLSAYVNACAHLGNPLDDALLDATAGTLTCAWHGFCYDATSGECLTLPGAQLDQLPLRVDGGHVWVRAVA